MKQSGGPRLAPASQAGHPFSPSGAPLVAGSPQRSLAHPIQESRDPRWVLALRVAEQVEGTILVPERREKLVRLGRMIGLTAFDSNLVIAIVQDQARRGCSPSDCPRAGESQLAMISLPAARTRRRQRNHSRVMTAAMVAVLIAFEFFILLGWTY